MLNNVKCNNNYCICQKKPLTLPSQSEAQS